MVTFFLPFTSTFVSLWPTTLSSYSHRNDLLLSDHSLVMLPTTLSDDVYQAFFLHLALRKTWFRYSHEFPRAQMFLAAGFIFFELFGIPYYWHSYICYVLSGDFQKQDLKLRSVKFFLLFENIFVNEEVTDIHQAETKDVCAAMNLTQNTCTNKTSQEKNKSLVL